MADNTTASDRGNILLSLNAVHAGYGKQEILRGVSLIVSQNETVCLLGANGTGKSTLAKTILGLVDSRQGTVTLRGVEIQGWPTHKRVTAGIRYLPQSRPVFSDMSVIENLLLGAHMDRDRSQVRERLEHGMSIFPQLKNLLSRRAGVLSGGERQMVGMARALMARAELLVLDEPSAGLSPKYVDLLFESLRQVQAEGLSILVVEQNAARALSFSDHAYVLDRGEIVTQGNASELRENEQFRTSYLSPRALRAASET